MITILSTVEYDTWIRFETEDGSSLRVKEGTGANFEITYLKVQTPRQGIGRLLLVTMLRYFLPNPPYATVYGFTRSGNADAHAFYRAVGFTLSPVQGVYDEGSAVVFSARYDDLCALHGV